MHTYFKRFAQLCFAVLILTSCSSASEGASKVQANNAVSQEPSENETTTTEASTTTVPAATTQGLPEEIISQYAPYGRTDGESTEEFWQREVYNWREQLTYAEDGWPVFGDPELPIFLASDIHSDVSAEELAVLRANDEATIETLVTWDKIDQLGDPGLVPQITGAVPISPARKNPGWQLRGIGFANSVHDGWYRSIALFENESGPPSVPPYWELQTLWRIEDGVAQPYSCNTAVEQGIPVEDCDILGPRIP